MPYDNRIRAIMYKNDKKLYRACSYALSEQKVLDIGKKRGFETSLITKTVLEAKKNPMTIYIIQLSKD